MIEQSKEPTSTLSDDFEDPKHRRRPLHKGELVPHIPTMLEQLDMVRSANSPARRKGA